MRRSLFMVALAALLAAFPVVAAETPGSAKYNGIWISTPYPSFNTGAGETVTLDLSVHNAGLPPQRVALELGRVPAGWSGTFLGDGKRVQSVFVAPDDRASVKLRLEPAAKVGVGTHRVEVLAVGDGTRFRLPIELTVGQSLPPKLTLKPELPELPGSPTSEFDFKVAVRNDGGEDATVRFDVGAPQGFRVKLTENYGSQELTSLPLKVGEEKKVSVKVTPAFGTKQGRYPVVLQAASGKAQASTQLAMEVGGEPKLSLTGRDERLSARAEAGEETPLELVVLNQGTAPARGIKFESSAPSGWKVSFEPERLDELSPEERRTVSARVTPSSKAIAGDYMLTLRAVTDHANQSSDFRVTVHTSTLWGVAGVLVIAAALVVLVAAMMRYGRR